jgi:hypothetical protein
MIFACRRSRVGFTHQARVSRILIINKLPDQTYGRYCNGRRITIRSTGAPNSGAVIVTAAITFACVIAGLNVWAKLRSFVTVVHHGAKNGANCLCLADSDAWCIACALFGATECNVKRGSLPLET